jgi:UDP-N-acetyl-D-mannosaminuronate dehydrogenase
MFPVKAMPKECVLIVGLGEIGHPLYNIFKDSGEFEVYGVDIDSEKMKKAEVRSTPPERNIDVMHICYPCPDQQQFVKTTLDYIRKFEPKLTIIESTVNPGTTQKIYELAKVPIVHSPIRGMHKTLETMKKDILCWRKFVGGTTSEGAEAAKRHLEKLGIRVTVLRSPVETELAKILDTTYKAWLIVCFQEMHRITRALGADFDEIVEVIEDGHRGILDRPINYPSVIGGHCLIPNTELLLRSYDSKLLKLILESNEKRKEEVKDEAVLRDIEKIRKRVKTLDKDLSRKPPDP